MFDITPRSAQVYSPFGSYVVEQHGVECLQRYIDDLPRPDVRLGKEHPLVQETAGRSWLGFVLTR